MVHKQLMRTLKWFLPADKIFTNIYPNMYRCQKNVIRPDDNPCRILPYLKPKLNDTTSETRLVVCV
ncbi:MAG: hypothetical protein JWQ84_199 [Mucilaginibacter sp.]|nr:hypothetical protein [Mucilaginibacter sp.]